MKLENLKLNLKIGELYVINFISNFFFGHWFEKCTLTANIPNKLQSHINYYLPKKNCRIALESGDLVK